MKMVNERNTENLIRLKKSTKQNKEVESILASKNIEIRSPDGKIIFSAPKDCDPLPEFHFYLTEGMDLREMANKLNKAYNLDTFIPSEIPIEIYELERLEFKIIRWPHRETSSGFFYCLWDINKATPEQFDEAEELPENHYIKYNRRIGKVRLFGIDAAEIKIVGQKVSIRKRGRTDYYPK